jgi:hypothetical protein
VRAIYTYIYLYNFILHWWCTTDLSLLSLNQFTLRIVTMMKIGYSGKNILIGSSQNIFFLVVTLPYFVFNCFKSYQLTAVNHGKCRHPWTSFSYTRVVSRVSIVTINFYWLWQPMKHIKKYGSIIAKSVLKFKSIFRTNCAFPWRQNKQSTLLRCLTASNELEKSSTENPGLNNMEAIRKPNPQK